jgi:hypothetical protein
MDSTELLHVAYETWGRTDKQMQPRHIKSFCDFTQQANKNNYWNI